MKRIKAKETNKMIRVYKLDDNYSDALKSVVEEINDSIKNKELQCESWLTWRMSPECVTNSKEKETAIEVLLHYYGLQFQSEHGCNFDKISFELSRFLNCSFTWIQRYFRGMSYFNPRWKDRVYVADRCGLNCLELN